ncbi:MAG: Clp protease ClpP [Ruminococcus sp.]|uniref:head maturation protease, ClpP-related n=1 Tax=Ruminococcus sp. TaxID=41978 RepID=UPI0025D6E877|nr:head maturation protease, ClpP-related [Ruminococcus sp.]MCR5599528.1 Clp protease ClpP [Ruminococcus sp.]
MPKTSKHFWNWTKNADENILHLNGTIAEESWFEDDITPALFRAELETCSAPITVYINSPGGDCVAAAQIYTMLMDYPHDVTVKIDGIAASAASVIAMAGTKVLMSPVSMLMIHNPATVAMGDHTDMKKAIAMLDSVKESIINAYEKKTGLSRKELSAMMDSETWMDANEAVELGFADGILERETQRMSAITSSVLFSQRKADATLVNRMMRDAVPVQPYYDRLAKLK